MIMRSIKSAAYGLLDIATFRKGVLRTVNNMAIRFPARWSRYYEAEYEKENYDLLKTIVKTDAQILDIGAHIGLFSVFCSKLAGPGGRIICFEPTPGTYAILKDTLRLNHCDNVTAQQAAVSDKEGKATFYVSHTAGCNSNSLIKNKSGNQLSGYDVRLVSIDSIVSEHSIKPSLIKIDVEGAELDALKGGLKTFKDLKPVIILGLHPDFIKQKGDSLEAIWDLLMSSGYTVKQEEKVYTKEDFCSPTTLFDVHCF